MPSATPLRSSLKALQEPLLLTEEQVGGRQDASSPDLSQQLLQPPRRKPRGRVILAPFAAAASEASSYPHNPNCVHCQALLLPDEARWGSGLCDGCYENCVKSCNMCGKQLHLKQLHWASGLCDPCYDTSKALRQRDATMRRSPPRSP